jgi:catechol 2,3-dioxygenase-like lactoylglutathione lyase family enzyme
MLPVKDVARARAFYEGCLGLKPGGFRPDGKFVYTLGSSTRTARRAAFPSPRSMG